MKVTVMTNDSDVTITEIARQELADLKRSKWEYGIIGFCIGVIVTLIWKGRMAAAFWEGLSG